MQNNTRCGSIIHHEQSSLFVYSKGVFGSVRVFFGNVFVLYQRLPLFLVALPKVTSISGAVPKVTIFLGNVFPFYQYYHLFLVMYESAYMYTTKNFGIRPTTYTVPLVFLRSRTKVTIFLGNVSVLYQTLPFCLVMYLCVTKGYHFFW